MGSLFKILLVGGGALWALSKLGLVAAGSSLVAFLSNVRLGGGGVQLEITLQNPASAGFDVNAITGKVTVNGMAAGVISSFDPVRVNPVSESKIWVTVRPDVVGVLSTLTTLLGDNKPAGLSVRLDGSINVNGDLLPLDLTLNK